MRKIYYLILLTVLVTGVSVLYANSSKADESNVKEIGTAINDVSIPGAAYGEGSNGEEWAYAVAGGSPAVFNIVNAETGESVDSFELEGADSSWALTVDPEGKVYIGSYSNGNLYRYTPGDDKVENLGKAISGESYIWRISSDEQGRIYGGTYPNGKVFQYDPETDEFRDYGQMSDGQQYARSIDIYKDKAYVGIGTNGPNLVELDIETGEKREIELPEKFDHETNVYDMTVVRDKLFARVTGVSTILVFDLKTMEIIDEIENADGLDVSPAGPKNLAFLIIDGELHSYNLQSLELTPTGFDNLFSARGLGWINIGGKEYPGKTLVGITWNGDIRHYNPITGNHRIVPGQIDGQPVDIQSLAQGPNGNIFVGGYFSGGLAEYDYENDQLTEYKGMGQIEGMATHGDTLYMGVYTGAELFSYDPNQAYEYGTNPAKHFELKDQDQDRPFALVSAGDKLAVGTVPDYGKLGGALTIFDPMTEEYEFHRNIVENQSIISLEYKDGLVYGGTSVWGGLGIQPSEEEAKLFVWDVENGQKDYETVPVPGEKAISALTFDDEGYLWGLTSGVLFKYDPEQGEVLEEKELYSLDWGQVGHLWRGGFLTYDEDGNLYGQTHGELFKVDPDTLEHETLVDDALLFAEDGEGNFYFARDHKLYKYER
ncbi:WD40 repeat domain-containing protein [Thalassobacillus sp. CUG 92003]|uniref:WD40 repeat domain-containing protein n=1 Tax=Thalassobacillus sp. CUG 92003 TaxID=2736641 RepID=UPI0015E79E06|nr:WD40 repeat domain-containing protein [Thalassobacillus sp. CUG 92003]